MASYVFKAFGDRVWRMARFIFLAVYFVKTQERWDLYYIDSESDVMDEESGRVSPHDILAATPTRDMGAVPFMSQTGAVLIYHEH